MNYLDIIIILFLAYGAFRGFSKGLIVEIATLLGLIFGVFIAIRYSYYTENFLRDFFNVTSKYLSYISLAVTFLLISVVVYLLGKLLTGLVNVIALGLANKLFGMLFGAAKYFIVVCILLMILDVVNDKFHFINEETKEKSWLFYPFLNFAQKIYNTVRF